MTPPNKFTGSDEQLWQSALNQLQTQMTRATYDTWLKGTRIVSRHNGQMVLGTKNPFAKDWLENRLRDTVQRTVAHIVGHPVEIQVVVEETDESELPNSAPVELMPEDRPSFLNEPNGHRSKKQSQKSANTTASTNGKKQPAVPQDNGLLAVDIRVMNQTGYQPLPGYYSIFIVPYLNKKWGATDGPKVYLLWEQEAAISGDYLLSDEFCNWTSPATYKFDELAERLGVSKGSLTGKDGYCERFRQAKLAGQPLPACCGTHLPDSTFTAGKYCKYWITGVLEMLSDEGMLTVQESGGRKNHRIKIQVWRSWPVLSRYQVEKYLAPSMQDKHKKWVQGRAANKLGITWEKWQAEEIPNGVEQFSDRRVGRECFARFIRNPFRLRALEKERGL